MLAFNNILRRIKTIPSRKRKSEEKRKQEGQELLRQLVDGKESHEINWKAVIAVANEYHAKEMKQQQEQDRKQRLLLPFLHPRTFKSKRKEQPTHGYPNKDGTKRKNVGVGTFSVNLLTFTGGDDVRSDRTGSTSSSKSRR